MYSGQATPSTLLLHSDFTERLEVLLESLNAEAPIDVRSSEARHIHQASTGSYAAGSLSLGHNSYAWNRAELSVNQSLDSSEEIRANDGAEGHAGSQVHSIQVSSPVVVCALIQFLPLDLLGRVTAPGPCFVFSTCWCHRVRLQRVGLEKKSLPFQSLLGLMNPCPLRIECFAETRCLLLHTNMWLLKTGRIIWSRYSLAL
jgi:hypothetical protein